MKSDGKKGLSIGVIIVIVIVTLVIAMLATVFTIRLVSAKLKEPVVKKAQESAAMQNANNAWMDYMAENFNKANYQENICIKSTVDGNDYYFHVVDGDFKSEAVAAPKGKGTTDHTGCTFAQATIVNGTLSLLTA